MCNCYRFNWTIDIILIIWNVQFVYIIKYKGIAQNKLDLTAQINVGHSI